MEVLFGILIPFIGTALGSACVFFMKRSLGDLVQRALAGFAAGVMVAASIWSLLIPAIEQSEDMGKLSFLPAFIGFWVGVLFLLLLDRLIPHLHIGSDNEIAFIDTDGFDYNDGECLVRFDTIMYCPDKKLITFAVTKQGRISVLDYQVFEDERGHYIEYGSIYEKIYIDETEACK